MTLTERLILSALLALLELQPHDAMELRREIKRALGKGDCNGNAIIERLADKTRY